MSSEPVPSGPAGLSRLLDGIGTALARIEHDLLAVGHADIDPLNRLVEDLHARKNAPGGLAESERLALAQTILEVDRLIARLRQATHHARREMDAARRAGEAAVTYARLQTG